MIAETRHRPLKRASASPPARLDLLTFRVRLPATPVSIEGRWPHGAPCRARLADGVGYRARFWFASRASPGRVWLVVYGYAVPFVIARLEQVSFAPPGWPDELPPMPEWAG